MKFKNINTGVVLAPKSQEVIEQLKNNSDYETFYEEKKEPKKVEKKSVEKTEE